MTPSELPIRYVLLSLATSMAMLMIASLVGSLVMFGTIGWISTGPGFAWLYDYHPRLLIYGFFGIFLANDAFIIFPSRKFLKPNVGMAKLVYGFIVSGLLIRLIPASQTVAVSGALLVLASCLYAYQVNLIANHKPSLPADLISRMSSLFLVGATILDFWAHLQGIFREIAWSNLIIVGFLVLAILDEEARTFPVLAGTRRPPILVLKVAVSLVAVGAAVSYLVRYISTPAWAVSSVLELAGASIFMFAIGVFARTTLLIRQMERTDRQKYFWMRRHVGVAYLWLTVGLVLYLLFATLPIMGYGTYGRLYDGYLHSITIGFLLNTLFGYEPILMPAHLNIPASPKLRYEPFVSLNIGNALRVVGDVGAGFGAPVAVIGLGVVLTGLGVIGFILMMAKSLTGARK